MGSRGTEEEITVLVTGFGPFRAQNPINPSWEVAKSLPPFLPPPQEDHTTSIAYVVNHPPVRILVHPEAVRVAYKTVRPLVPELWEGHKIDYMVHIGMASGRRYYSVERRGHRDRYTMPDVDHELLGDEDLRKKEGDKWIWAGMPEEILTDVKVDDVWRRWRVALPNTDVRISENAGRYLCDFIYFSSLAYLEKKQEKKRVVFLHVPVDVTDTAIQTGIDATIELIRAMVYSDRMSELLEKVAPPVPHKELSTT